MHAKSFSPVSFLKAIGSSYSTDSLPVLLISALIAIIISRRTMHAPQYHADGMYESITIFYNS